MNHGHILPPVDATEGIVYTDGCQVHRNKDGSWTFTPVGDISAWEALRRDIFSGQRGRTETWRLIEKHRPAIEAEVRDAD